MNMCWAYQIDFDFTLAKTPPLRKMLLGKIAVQNFKIDKKY